MCAAHAVRIHNGLHKSHRDPCTHNCQRHVPPTSKSTCNACTALWKRIGIRSRRPWGALCLPRGSQARARHAHHRLGRHCQVPKTCKPLYEQGHQEAAIRPTLRAWTHGTTASTRWRHKRRLQARRAPTPNSSAWTWRSTCCAKAACWHGKSLKRMAGEGLDQEERKAARLHNGCFSKARAAACAATPNRPCRAKPLAPAGRPRDARPPLGGRVDSHVGAPGCHRHHPLSLQRGRAHWRAHLCRHE